MVVDGLFLVAGAIVVLVTLFDVFATTISLSSARGPLSSRVSAGVWRILRRPRNDLARRAGGPLVMITVLLGWLFALTLGWTLVFNVDGSLESAASPEQQSSDVRLIDSAFFVFGSLIGRGATELSPAEVGWSTVVAIMSVTGVGLITLSLAWLLPVVAAVVQKRALAATISTLGQTPQDIVARAWNGRDLGNLDLHLLPLIAEFNLLAQRHLAFPVIHYFQSADHRTAIGPQVACLDDALSLIAAAELDTDRSETNLDGSTTVPLRQAISDYLATLHQVFIHPSDDDLERPATDVLTDLGLFGAEAHRRLDDILERNQQRRRLVNGYLHADGWRYEDVAYAEGDADADPEEIAAEDISR